MIVCSVTDIKITNKEKGLGKFTKQGNQIIPSNWHTTSQIQGANSIDPTEMNTNNYNMQRCTGRNLRPGHRAAEQNACTASTMQATNGGYERGITPRSREKTRTKDKFLETGISWAMIPEKLK